MDPAENTQGDKGDPNKPISSGFREPISAPRGRFEGGQADTQPDLPARPPEDAEQDVEDGISVAAPSAESEEVSHLLKSIIEWSIKLLRVEAGEIYLYDPRARQLKLSVVCGTMSRYYGATLQPGEGLAGKVFLVGEPIRVDDYNSWEGRAPQFASDTAPYQAEISVPLRWGQNTIGVLNIVSNGQQRPFTDADLDAARLVANLAAVAIENARLYQELQDSLRQIKSALEQEVVQQTREITRQVATIGRVDAANADVASDLSTGELLSRVIELRTTKKVLAEIAQVPLGRTSLQDLTPREIQILGLIGQGYSNKEIASELNLAVSTVKFHVGSILGKLGLPDRTQAALCAVRMGLVKPP